MKKLIALIVGALPLCCVAADESRCDRIFMPDSIRESCEVALSVTKRAWTDDELQNMILKRWSLSKDELAKEIRREEDAAEEEVKKDALRVALRAKLEAAANKSASMHLKLLMPGMLLKTVRELYPSIDCHESAESPTECNYTPSRGGDKFSRPDLESLAEHSVLIWSFKFAPGEKLAVVYAVMGSDAFSDVAKALVAKYGKATSITVMDLQNGFGAKFRGSKLTWHRGDIQLEVKEYAGNRDRMSLLLASTNALQTLARFEARKVKKAVKDL